MTKALEIAVKKVKSLSPERQDFVAELLEQIAAAGEDVYVLEGEELRMVEEGLAQLDRAESVSADVARRVFEKYR